ncbi:hypothetical protein LPJ56_007011 [Coemansia sp. RSA 2599]|nr:hypothetical protein LPJ75_007079 [Coemansia sp. RSA 2598]KAJ1803224.1 hypothetical protein LPJ56_007011 [Coemansia sp. RSA 2599]
MYLYVANKNYLNNIVSGYSMKVPADAPAVNGAVVGGDLSTITILGTLPPDNEQPSSTSDAVASKPSPSASKPPAESKSSEEKDEPSSSDDGLDNTDSNSAQETEEKGKKSNIVTIIIIVLGVLAVLGIIAFLWWRRRRNQKRKQNINLIDTNNGNYMDGATYDRPMSTGSAGVGRLNRPIIGGNRDSGYSNYSRGGGRDSMLSQDGFTPIKGKGNGAYGDEKRINTYAW